MPNERCKIRIRLREIGAIPKSGFPNTCATCSGEKKPENCNVVLELEKMEQKSRQSDWNKSDLTIAY